MKNLLPLVCMAVLVWTTSATAQEKDTLDSLTKEMIAAMKTACDVLETVKDKKTADDAKTKVRASAKTLADLKQRGDKLGKQIEQKEKEKQEKELKAKYGKMLEEQVRRLIAESIRLQNVEGGKELLKELEDAGK